MCGPEVGCCEDSLQEAEGMGPGGVCAEADGSNIVEAPLESPAVPQLTECQASSLVALRGDGGGDGCGGSGTVGLSHRRQPFETDSPHRGPLGKKVVGDSSMRPVRAGRVLNPPHPALRLY